MANQSCKKCMAAALVGGIKSLTKTNPCDQAAVCHRCQRQRQRAAASQHYCLRQQRSWRDGDGDGAGYCRLRLPEEKSRHGNLWHCCASRRKQLTLASSSASVLHNRSSPGIRCSETIGFDQRPSLRGGDGWYFLLVYSWKLNESCLVGLLCLHIHMYVCIRI